MTPENPNDSKINEGSAKNSDSRAVELLKEAAPEIIDYAQELQKKEELLRVLPSDLPIQKKFDENPDSVSLAEITIIIERRFELGPEFEKVRYGYHISNIDISCDDYLKPDSTGELHYALDIKNLYGKHAGGFLYKIEVTYFDTEQNKQLGWMTTKGRARIVDKKKITSELLEELGGKFANVEYHG